MLKFVSVYGPIDMPEDGEMEFVLKGPALSDDFISGSYSQGYTLPFSRNNQAFFKNAQFVETRDRIKVYDNIMFYASNIHWFTGKINLIKINEKGYLISYSITGFAIDVFGKKLKDVNYGSDYYLGYTQFDILAAAKLIAMQNYPAVNFNFPTVECISFYYADNEDVTTGTNANFRGKINNYERLLDRFIPNVYDPSLGAINKNTMVPMLYLFFVIKKAIEDLGYKWSGNFFDDSELATIVLFNTYSLDDVRDTEILKVFQPGIVNYSLFSGDPIRFSDETTPPYKDDYNCWNPSTFIFTTPWTGVFEFTIVLNLGPNWTNFGGIDIELDVNGVSTWYQLLGVTGPQPQTWTMVTSLTLNTGDQVRVMYRSTNGSDNIDFEDAELTVKDVSSILNHSTSIKYSNHVPDMTISTFLKEIAKIPGVYLTFNPRIKDVKFNFRKDIFTAAISQFPNARIKKQPEITISDRGWKFAYDFSNDPLAENNFKPVNQSQVIATVTNHTLASLPTAYEQYLYEKTTDRYYVSKWNPAPDNAWSWEPYSHSSQQLVIGSGATEIVSAFSPALMVVPQNILDIPALPFKGTVIMPKIEAPGNSIIYDQIGNAWPNKLMFYRGMYNFSGLFSNKYPFATSLHVHPDGTEPFTKSLLISSGKGPYYSYWKLFCDAVLNSDSIQMDLDLSISDIDKLDPNQRMAIFRDLFLYENIKISITHSGIQITRADLIQIKA